MPNSKIIVLETTVAYIKFLKDCDPSQLLAIAKNSSNLVPSGVDPAIIPKVINSTTMESFNYTVLEKIYSPDFDMSILDTKTYIFDDETGSKVKLLEKEIIDLKAPSDSTIGSHLDDSLNYVFF